ncbi:putative leucine-rich repeat domain-like protein, partial [Tanacetum coccineum]
MRNKSHRPAKQKGGDRRSNPNDFISQIPNDLLVKILSLLPIKDATVTSTLSSRWRFVWCSLTQLNFDGNVTFDNEVDMDWEVFRSERSKYIKQVENVIQQYNHPKIQDFQICFYLNCDSQGLIDEWLHFAVNKNVEFLELDLKNYHNVYEEEYVD